VTLKAKDASLLRRRHPCVTRRRRRQESAAPGRVLSDLGVLVPAGGRVGQLTVRLDRVYFDTERHNLLLNDTCSPTA